MTKEKPNKTTLRLISIIEAHKTRMRLCGGKREKQSLKWLYAEIEGLVGVKKEK